MRRLLLTAVLASCATPLWAAADATPLTPLYSCQDIPDPTLRLACYDEAANSLKTSESKGEVVAVDKAKAESIQREAFGFHLPSLPKIGLPGSGMDIEAVTATVIRMQPLGEGQYLMTLDNGQIWEQIDDQLTPPRPFFPTTVTIKKAAMGSFLMKVGNQRAVRVRRAQ